MATDLVVCPNATDDVYTEKERTQNPSECTTSSRSSPSLFRLANLWTSSQNSSPTTPPPFYSTVFLPRKTKAGAPRRPIITLKLREAIRGDQESMEEEIAQLKRALLDKETELRNRKVQSANIEAHNRKLAKDIESLEENSRTGSPRRLHSKIAGLKVMLEEAHNTCELQAIELCELQRDVRLTHALEMEVERNKFATEAHRLQQLVNKLEEAYGHIGQEPRVVGCLRAKNHHLEVMNLRLSSCLSATLNQIPRSNLKSKATPRTPWTPAQRDAMLHNTFDNCVQLHQVPPSVPCNNDSPSLSLPIVPHMLSILWFKTYTIIA